MGGHSTVGRIYAYMQRTGSHSVAQARFVTLSLTPGFPRLYVPYPQLADLCLVDSWKATFPIHLCPMFLCCCKLAWSFLPVSLCGELLTGSVCVSCVAVNIGFAMLYFVAGLPFYSMLVLLGPTHALCFVPMPLCLDKQISHLVAQLPK